MRRDRADPREPPDPERVPPAMVRRFLETLSLDGRARVGGADPASTGDLREGLDWLAGFEREYRRHLPGQPPGLDPAALRWSVSQFYRAAQCLVHRHLGEEVVACDLAVTSPSPLTPAVVYSVDLTFRFLPDLLRIARGASESDPLVARIVEWGCDWPLSSVGMTLPRLGPTEPILADRCLAALYRDRILTAGDRSRLESPGVPLLVQEAAGAHPELIDSLGPAARAALPSPETSPTESLAP